MNCSYVTFIILESALLHTSHDCKAYPTKSNCLNTNCWKTYGDANGHTVMFRHGRALQSAGSTLQLTLLYKTKLLRAVNLLKHRQAVIQKNILTMHLFSAAIWSHVTFDKPVTIYYGSFDLNHPARVDFKSPKIVTMAAIL
jgi:hypothetical protein